MIAIKLPVIINEARLDGLVDTGASLSVINPDLLFRKTMKDRREIRPLPYKVRMANGELLDTQGQTLVPVTLPDGNLVEQPMVVADVDIPLIFGLDFLRKQKCTAIDMEHGTITLGEKIFDLKIEAIEEPQRQVTASSTIVTLPHSEQRPLVDVLSSQWGLT